MFVLRMEKFSKKLLGVYCRKMVGEVEESGGWPCAIPSFSWSN